MEPALTDPEREARRVELARAAADHDAAASPVHEARARVDDLRREKEEAVRAYDARIAEAEREVHRHHARMRRAIEARKELKAMVPEEARRAEARAGGAYRQAAAALRRSQSDVDAAGRRVAALRARRADAGEIGRAAQALTTLEAGHADLERQVEALRKKHEEAEAAYQTELDRLLEVPEEAGAEA